MNGHMSAIRDWSSVKLHVRDDVQFWPAHDNGEPVFRVECSATGKFFSIGYQEYLLLSLLDGTNTVVEACGQAARASFRSVGNDSLDRQLSRGESLDMYQSVEVAIWAFESGILEVSGTKRDRVTESSPALNPLFVRLPVPGLARLINCVALPVSKLCHPAVVWGFIIFIAVSTIALGVEFVAFKDGANPIFDRNNWVWYLGT
ncbi:MAG: hypothetical protein AAF664_24640, partial [Planctomycetota bacterium]